MSKVSEDVRRLAYENACHQCQYWEDDSCTNKGECVWSSIENEAKAFELIKEKEVEVALIRYWFDHYTDEEALAKYNKLYHWKPLTMEEYKFLKEMFKHE